MNVSDPQTLPLEAWGDCGFLGIEVLLNVTWCYVCRLERARTKCLAPIHLVAPWMTCCIAFEPIVALVWVAIPHPVNTCINHYIWIHQKFQWVPPRPDPKKRSAKRAKAAPPPVLECAKDRVMARTGIEVSGLEQLWQMIFMEGQPMQTWVLGKRPRRQKSYVDIWTFQAY